MTIYNPSVDCGSYEYWDETTPGQVSPLVFWGDFLDSIWVVAHSHCLADVSNMDQLWFNHVFPSVFPIFPGKNPPLPATWSLFSSLLHSHGQLFRLWRGPLAPARALQLHDLNILRFHYLSWLEWSMGIISNYINMCIYYIVYIYYIYMIYIYYIYIYILYIPSTTSLFVWV